MHFLLVFFLMILHSSSLGLVVDIQYIGWSMPSQPITCLLLTRLSTYLLIIYYYYFLFFFVNLMFRLIDAGILLW